MAPTNTQTPADLSPASEAPDPANPRIALCLGTHRSGTSLVSAGLEALGASLSLSGRDVPNDENPKGFFEHPEVVALNETLLRYAGSAWDDPCFEPAWLDRVPPATLAQLRDDAVRLIESEFRPHPLAAVKDPRMCRLLPFWHGALGASGYAPEAQRSVFVTRDPVEVAISQRSRSLRSPDFYDFGQNVVEGAAIWVSHVRQALRDLEGREVFVVSYGDMVGDTLSQMAALAAYLGVDPEPEAVSRFFETFIDPELHRSRSDDAAAGAVEAAFPGLRDIADSLADLSGRVTTDAERAPVLAALDDSAYHRAIERTAAAAYGRVSSLRRKERATIQSYETQVAAEALNNAARFAERDAVEIGLRQRIADLEAGLHDRESQLAMLRNEQAGHIARLAVHVARVDAEYDAARVESAAALRLTETQRDAAIEAEATLRRALDESAADAEALRAQTATLSAQLGAREADLKARLVELVATMSALRNAERRAVALSLDGASLKDSRSWRVTAPMRAAGSALRVIKRGPRG